MLKINDLTYRIGERVLLDQVSATINPRQDHPVPADHRRAAGRWR
jgi:hypothetical protein